jgi:hypothetical protein
MNTLIRNYSDLKEELQELPYLDVKVAIHGSSKGDIYVYKKQATTFINRLINFLTVGDHFLVFHIKPIDSLFLHIRKDYAKVFISGIGCLQLDEAVRALTIVEKYRVCKIPLFDLHHLHELGYKFVLKEEIK